MEGTVACTPFRHIGLLFLRKFFSAFVRRDAASKDHYEVELKFKIDVADAEHLREVLPESGFRYTTTVEMSDTFLPAPYEGEIMRIRQEYELAGARRTVFTIKEWVKTRTGRTRKEAESDAPSTLALIFLFAGRFLSDRALLGFSKKRELFEGKLNGNELIVSIDEVFGLGEFSGWYMEAEVLVPLDKDPADYEQPILDRVQSLLGNNRLPVKQSYREMLLESYRLVGIA
jgi:adenylate cyclase class IV